MLLGLDRLAKTAFRFSEWCELRAIGKTALRAYREKPPEVLAILQSRLEQMTNVSRDIGALNTLERMCRQTARSLHLTCSLL